MPDAPDRLASCTTPPLPDYRDRRGHLHVPPQRCDCPASPLPHYPGEPNRPPSMGLESVVCGCTGDDRLPALPVSGERSRFRSLAAWWKQQAKASAMEGAING